MSVNRGTNTKQLRARLLLERGCDAYEAGNLAEAVQRFQQAARLGDPNAQLNLGNLYDAGEGVKMSFESAVHYYRLATRKGSPHAAYNLGVAYRNRGKDRWAQFWFQRAIDMGDADAAEELARDKRESDQKKGGL